MGQRRSWRHAGVGDTQELARVLRPHPYDLGWGWACHPKGRSAQEAARFNGLHRPLWSAPTRRSFGLPPAPAISHAAFTLRCACHPKRRSRAPHSMTPHSMALHSMTPHSMAPHSMAPHSMTPHSMTLPAGRCAGRASVSESGALPQWPRTLLTYTSALPRWWSRRRRCSGVRRRAG